MLILDLLKSAEISQSPNHKGITNNNNMFFKAVLDELNQLQMKSAQTEKLSFFPVPIEIELMGNSQSLDHSEPMVELANNFFQEIASMDQTLGLPDNQDAIPGWLPETVGLENPDNINLNIKDPLENPEDYALPQIIKNNTHPSTHIQNPNQQNKEIISQVQDEEIQFSTNFDLVLQDGENKTTNLHLDINYSKNDLIKNNISFNPVPKENRIEKSIHFNSHLNVELSTTSNESGNSKKFNLIGNFEFVSNQVEQNLVNNHDTNSHEKVNHQSISSNFEITNTQIENQTQNDHSNKKNHIDVEPGLKLQKPQWMIPTTGKKNDFEQEPVIPDKVQFTVNSKIDTLKKNNDVQSSFFNPKDLEAESNVRQRTGTDNQAIEHQVSKNFSFDEITLQNNEPQYISQFNLYPLAQNADSGKYVHEENISQNFSFVSDNTTSMSTRTNNAQFNRLTGHSQPEETQTQDLNQSSPKTDPVQNTHRGNKAPSSSEQSKFEFNHFSTQNQSEQTELMNYPQAGKKDDLKRILSHQNHSKSDLSNTQTLYIKNDDFVQLSQMIHQRGNKDFKLDFFNDQNIKFEIEIQQQDNQFYFRNDQKSFKINLNQWLNQIVNDPKIPLSIKHFAAMGIGQDIKNSVVDYSRPALNMKSAPVNSMVNTLENSPSSPWVKNSELFAAEYPGINLEEIQAVVNQTDRPLKTDAKQSVEPPLDQELSSRKPLEKSQNLNSEPLENQLNTRPVSESSINLELKKNINPQGKNFAKFKAELSPKDPMNDQVGSFDINQKTKSIPDTQNTTLKPVPQTADSPAPERNSVQSTTNHAKLETKIEINPANQNSQFENSSNQFDRDRALNNAPIKSDTNFNTEIEINPANQNSQFKNNSNQFDDNIALNNTPTKNDSTFNTENKFHSLQHNQEKNSPPQENSQNQINVNNKANKAELNPTLNEVKENIRSNYLQKEIERLGNPSLIREKRIEVSSPEQQRQYPQSQFELNQTVSGQIMAQKMQNKYQEVFENRKMPDENSVKAQEGKQTSSTQSQFESRNLNFALNTNPTDFQAEKTEFLQPHETLSPKQIEEADIQQQVIHQMKFSLKKDVKEAVIQLKPKELGRIFIKLQIQKGQVELQLKTENSVVQSELNKNIESLVSALKDQNLIVTKTEITILGNTEQSSKNDFSGRDDQRQQHQDSFQQNQQRDFSQQRQRKDMQDIIDKFEKVKEQKRKYQEV